MHAGRSANLRMGTRIPVMMMATAPLLKDVPAGPIQYKDVGTNIDCHVSTSDDGRPFRRI